MTGRLPVAVIGAGPVGLAAAAHLALRDQDFVVLERGPTAGSSVRGWAHVRMFSAWSELTDPAAGRLLEPTGWSRPDPAAFPTGGELLAGYLEPLAGLPTLSHRIRLRSRVTRVSRARADRAGAGDRAQAPFVLRIDTPGGETEILARAVIDASGTWTRPNPLGSAGVPAPGETAAGDRVRYRIPDLLGRDRDRYVGKRVLVVGSGHSAFHALLDLTRLAGDAPRPALAWAIRRTQLGDLFRSGPGDQLAERARLAERTRATVARGGIEVATGFALDRIERTDDGVVAWSGNRQLGPVDQIIGVTGFRPDLAMLGELRLRLDPATECPVALGPLIDPNVHTCGTVPPHGAAELRHDEPDFFIVGMKSYGRAPTFLLLTGYGQVRSVVAELAGDPETASLAGQR